MTYLGLALMIVGGIGSLIYGIRLLILAFQKSIWWGLGSLLVPFVGLIFVVMHWAEAGKIFLIGLAFSVLTFIGMALGAFGGRPALH